MLVLSALVISLVASVSQGLDVCKPSIAEAFLCNNGHPYNVMKMLTSRAWGYKYVSKCCLQHHPGLVCIKQYFNPQFAGCHEAHAIVFVNDSTIVLDESEMNSVRGGHIKQTMSDGDYHIFVYPTSHPDVVLWYRCAEICPEDDILGDEFVILVACNVDLCCPKVQTALQEAQDFFNTLCTDTNLYEIQLCAPIV